MAALTRSGMRTLVKQNLGWQDDTTYDSSINTWLDWSLRDLQNNPQEHAWADLENESTLDTVADTKTYDLDSSLSMILTLRISDYDSDEDTYSGSRDLPLLSQYELDQRVPRVEQQATGKPIYAIWFGKQLALCPIPDDVYRITYRWKSNITEFANDQAVSGIKKVDDVLVARATWYAWVMQEEWQNAAMFSQIYEMGLRRAIGEDRRQPAWSPVAQPFRPKSVALPSTDDPFYKLP